jgi:hypothetical protein
MAMEEVREVGLVDVRAPVSATSTLTSVFLSPLSLQDVWTHTAVSAVHARGNLMHLTFAAGLITEPLEVRTMGTPFDNKRTKKY